SPGTWGRTTSFARRTCGTSGAWASPWPRSWTRPGEVTNRNHPPGLYLGRVPCARQKVRPVYRAEVRIELKPGVADPEGANTKKALELLGFRGVSAVKSVHAFSVDLDAKSESDAKATVDEMCKRLLVNPVIHAP